MDVIKVRLQLPTSAGPHPVEIDVEDVPTKLSELAPLAHMIADTFVDAATTTVEAQGERVSCEMGCAACCRHYVAISIPEALHLLDHLDAMPADDQKRFRQRTNQVVKELRSAKLLKRAFDPAKKPHALDKLPRQYFRLQLACPFLEDELCSIHDVRPTGCRTYSVVSPPRLCDTPYTGDIVPLETPLAASSPLAHMTGKLLGKPPALLPLSLLYRWEKRLQPLRGRTWPGPDLVRAFARELFPES